MQSEDSHLNEAWNGGVEATSTLAGAFLAFAFAYIKLNWALVGEILLIVISIIDGIILVVMGYAQNIWIAYLGYLLYRPLFQMLITIASFEIARQIKTDCCGVVFGVNTFFALAFQTILTLIVVEALNLSTQTMVNNTTSTQQFVNKFTQPFISVCCLWSLLIYDCFYTDEHHFHLHL